MLLSIQFRDKMSTRSDNFVKGGFRAWNRKSGLDEHNVGKPHILAVEKCQSLMNQKQSITTAFDNQTLLDKNEHYIRLCCSIDVVRFLLRQALSFRGHDETEESPNKGNFLELLRWLGKRCDVAWRTALKKKKK